MIPQPLSDGDIEKLSELLKRFGEKGAMSVEELDGFLAASICGPEDVSHGECLQQILGINLNDANAVARQPSLQDCISLISRRLDEISYALQTGEAFTPLLLEDQRGIATANDWASGFVRAMELHKDDWGELLADEQNGGALVPILALAHEHDPDPELRSYKEPISDELRERLIVGAAAGVMKIYRYFRTQRLIAEAGDETFTGATHRRIVPKVGRNDPCPCGSGKKFKHCCGKVVLH